MKNQLYSIFALTDSGVKKPVISFLCQGKTILKKTFFVIFAFLIFAPVISQQVHLGKEGEISAMNHIPVIVHKDSEKMLVVRMSKINPQGFKILMENKKATLSAFFIGYGRANSDESVMNLDNYFSKGNEYALEIYDNNLNLTKSYPFDVVLEKSGMLASTGSKAIFPKKICYLNGKITFFSTLYDSKSKKITAGYHFLSNDGVLEKELKPLAEIAITDDDLEKQITYVVSPDHSKILMYYPVEAATKSDKPGVFVKVIHAADFSQIWESNYFFPDKDVNIEKVLLNNSGHIFMLTRNALEGKEKEQSAQKYRYVLYTGKKENKTLENFNLKISDQYFLNNMLVKFDHRGNLLASGFYSEKSANYAKGAFVVNMDAGNGATLINALVPFSAGISEDKEESDKEKAFFHMRDISFLSDGSITLTGEQYYIDISTSRGAYGGVGGSTNFGYRYKDILVMCLNPAGELRWMKTVTKKQFTNNDGAMYSSIVPVIQNNKISILVNGHRDGLEKRLSAFTDRNIVYMLEFDGSGNMATKSLYSGDQAETRLSPKVSYKVNEQEIVLYNVRASGKFRFARVNF